MSHTKRPNQRKFPIGRPRAHPEAFPLAAEGAARLWEEGEVQRAAEVMLRSEGVRGVAVGCRRRAGAWIDEPCVTVFVDRKWPGDRLKEGEDFAARFPTVPVDVIEVGTPHAAVLDAADRVLRNGINDRSAITTILWYTSGTWVLACGHGVVPGGRPGSVITTKDDLWVVVSDDRTSSYHALVYVAEFDGLRDVCLLRVDGAPPPRLTHPLTGTAAKHSLRKGAVHLGLRLKHFSPERQRVLVGTITAMTGQHLPSTRVDVRAPNNEWVTYPAVYTVAADNPYDAFVVGGDSGSLVTDEENNVVGTVIGRSSSERLGDGRTAGVGFVLPLNEHTLDIRSKGIDLRRFFR